MVRWLLCGFIFVVFTTSLNWMYGVRAVWRTQCEANSKRIWLHLKCTMAFIHPTIWIMLSTNWDKHVVHTERERTKKRTKHSYQMYRTSFAFLLFVCLLTCLLDFFPFVCSFIHSFFLSLFNSCFISLSLSRALVHLRVVNEVFRFYSYPCCWFGFVIESIHIGWFFGLCFACCCLFSTSYALTTEHHFVALLVALFASSSSEVLFMERTWVFDETDTDFQMKCHQNASP